MSQSIDLASYRLLGRSGLRVSPICLGAMNFGQPGFGATDEEAQKIFSAYVDRGGNFFDTANYYANGRSEELLGQFIGSRRDEMVIATKYSLAAPGDVNASGNHRKSMMRNVEDSLRRLGTDQIDLFYLHVWDGNTPVDEVMRGLDDLVRQGKILYAGISDTPAWQVSRMQMLADLRGWSPLVALEISYSLMERSVETDLIPMAAELGLGVLPWSPLGGGILSGKYAGGPDSVVADSGRAPAMMAHGMLNDRAYAIAAAVAEIAAEIGVSSAQAALAWVLGNPAVTAPIVGARTLAQLEDNIAAVGVTLEPAHHEKLNDVSAIPLGFLGNFLKQDFIKAGLTSGKSIRPRAR